VAIIEQVAESPPVSSRPNHKDCTVYEDLPRGGASRPFRVSLI
jgi:hypothetical protein